MKPQLSLGLTAVLVGTSLAPALAAKRASSLPGYETAEIRNTGSTNTMGYRIVVPIAGSHTGTAAIFHMNGMVTAGDPDEGNVPMPLVRKFARDLHAAMPLRQLPAGHGMKSASFGTSTFITYRGQRTPDLSFPANAHAQALRDDAIAIADALHVKNTPRRPALPLPPSLPGH
ncbi:MAG: hypothetical protein JO250_05790 [Armatimonadetes bacterium]|nr:hypothetical protein [Armatimonadota bacterium]